MKPLSESVLSRARVQRGSMPCVLSKGIREKLETIALHFVQISAHSPRHSKLTNCQRHNSRWNSIEAQRTVRCRQTRRWHFARKPCSGPQFRGHFRLSKRRPKRYPYTIDVCRFCPRFCLQWWHRDRVRFWAPHADHECTRTRDHGGCTGDPV